jgi:hypothetical protein
MNTKGDGMDTMRAVGNQFGRGRLSSQIVQWLGRIILLSVCGILANAATITGPSSLHVNLSYMPFSY